MSIKFKVIDTISGVIGHPSDGSNYCVTAVGAICVDETDDGGSLENRSYRSELRLYTGKRDNNGVQVYCGDTLLVFNKSYNISSEKHVVTLSEYADDEGYMSSIHYGFNLNGLPLVDCLGDGSLVVEEKQNEI